MQHCSERINAYQSSSSFVRQNWFLVGSFLVAVLCLTAASQRARERAGTVCCRDGRIRR